MEAKKHMHPIPAKLTKYLLPFFFCLILFLGPMLSGCQRYAAKFIGIESMGAAELQHIIKNNSKPLILDLRTERAYRQGHMVETGIL